MLPARWLVLSGCLGLSALGGCDAARPATTVTATNDAAAPSTTLADFSDGPWVLHVDRRYVGTSNNTNPGQPIAEEHYEAAASREYEVAVSQRGQRVSIGDTPWIGERVANQSDELMFDLIAGAFAGGRFVVWQDARGIQAELTLYGSGVPIAHSERGALTRDSR